MELGYIYLLKLNTDLLEFKSGEIYVGKHNGTKKEYFGSGKLVKSILNKYKKDVFVREILCREIDNDELLSFLERYYISYYKCNRSKTNFGLNLTDGGEGIFGYKHTEKQCKAVSNRIKKEYLENKRVSPKRKLVHQYDINTKKYIKYFETCTDAAREVDCTPSSIAYAARDVNAACKGYIWSYRKMDIIDKSEGHHKPILQYDLNNNFIREYKSATEAAELNNWKNSPICNCLNGKSMSSYKFKWKYKND